MSITLPGCFQIAETERLPNARSQFRIIEATSSLDFKNQFTCSSSFSILYGTTVSAPYEMTVSLLYGTVRSPADDTVDTDVLSATAKVSMEDPLENDALDRDELA
jgi:hypothetical protein